ncbi:MAG: acetyl-CoA C-acetyltransferase [Chloroflexota bacterium]
MDQPEVVIVAAARTPFGRLGGSLSSLSAVDLGAAAIREVVRRAGLAGPDVDQVIMGQVITAGLGQIPARQAALGAGLPAEVPALGINKVCGSALKAVNLGVGMIRAGDAEIVVAGGMESMSGAPYLLRKARFGYRMGHSTVDDAMLVDGLWCPVNDVPMASYGSSGARDYGVTREEQDRWAARSQERYECARAGGRFAEEIVPVEVAQSQGAPRVVAADEHPRPDTTLEKLARLTPAFEADGTITAGNAPGVNDGAAAVVVMARGVAERRGLRPLATVVATGEAALEPQHMAVVPVHAIRNALSRAGLDLDALALLEINEAFAAVPLVAARILGLDPERVNVNGGAVAVGHPIGASGARILMTLIYELRRRGGTSGRAGYGIAALCSGTAQGEATVVRVP